MNIRIYFNTNCLEITEDKPHPGQDQPVKTFILDKPASGKIPEIREQFLSAAPAGNIRVICSDIKKAYEEFKKSFVFIEAAGGFIEKQGSYLCIRRHGQWDLPKGKREKSESMETCAIRECEEECGITGLEIVRPLNPSFHVYSYKGAFALKESKWFYMLTSYDQKLVPQTEEDISEVRWFSKEEMTGIVLPDTYLTIKDVIKEALSL